MSIRESSKKEKKRSGKKETRGQRNANSMQRNSVKIDWEVAVVNLVERKTTTRYVIGVKHSLYRFQRHFSLFFSSHFFFFLFFPAEKKGVNKSFSLLSISLCSRKWNLDFYVSLKDGGKKELTKQGNKEQRLQCVLQSIKSSLVQIDFVYESRANLKTPIRRSNGVTTCASLWIVLINLP